MASDEAAALAASRRGSMVAPAGCGKTHAIAAAVAKHCDGRQLVLTHTHAGVDALRAKLKELGAPSNRVHVDTIAGWSLRLSAAFPKSSAVNILKPKTQDEFLAIYKGTEALLRMRPHQEILRASYAGVFVDEYQDCTEDQHRVVLALRDMLPTRVVGDPLQGIFNFKKNKTVTWAQHVDREFDAVQGPVRPRRWEGKNAELGKWLMGVARGKLEAGEALDISNAPLNWVAVGDRPGVVGACHAAADRGGTVVAIPARQQGWHDIATKLRGRFSCVEPVDSKDLYEAAKAIEAAVGCARVVAVMDFASKCMTKAGTELKSARAAFERGNDPRTSKHPKQTAALRAVRDDGSVQSVAAALEGMRKIEGVVVYRRELLSELLRALRVWDSGEATSLEEAAWFARNMTRERGRDCPKCAVGTTLLVKGLEFDHAIVLNADDMDAKNLYVAMTRGSRSLTVISETRRVAPKPTSSGSGQAAPGKSPPPRAGEEGGRA